MNLKLLLLINCLLIVGSQGFAQNTVPSINLFLDCNSCNEAYIKQNIDYVNYVRDRKTANVQLIINQQTTGSGGLSYTLRFIGLKKFIGQNDSLNFTVANASSTAEKRKALNKHIQIGIIPYVLQTPMAELLTFGCETKTTSDTTNKTDPWRNWVFSFSGNAQINREELIESETFYGSSSIKKVTPQWRYDLHGSITYSQSRYKIGEEIIKNDQKDLSAYAFFGKSINKHWSTAFEAAYYSSIYQNIDFEQSYNLGIEYNIFPYSQSARRELRFTLFSGYSFKNYKDSTIYNKIYEILPTGDFAISYQVVEKWGSAYSSISAKAFLQDFKKNQLSFYGYVNLRLVKGLFVTFSGSASMIRNQITLPKYGASQEEILLRQKLIATDYHYSIIFGLSYTFGSIYSSVVNPRFGF